MREGSKRPLNSIVSLVAVSNYTQGRVYVDKLSVSTPESARTAVFRRCYVYNQWSL